MCVCVCVCVCVRACVRACICVCVRNVLIFYIVILLQNNYSLPFKNDTCNKTNP